MLFTACFHMTSAAFNFYIKIWRNLVVVAYHITTFSFSVVVEVAFNL